jgi:hypothetical protein
MELVSCQVVYSNRNTPQLLIDPFLSRSLTEALSLRTASVLSSPMIDCPLSDGVGMLGSGYNLLAHHVLFCTA